MLQLVVHVDESGKGQNIFVSAGYLATAKKWAGYSAKWKAALDADPPIEYLKMSDAAAIPPRGQFSGFTEQQVLSKVGKLRRVIETHVLSAFWAAVPEADYRSVFEGKVSPSLNSPDFFAHFRLFFRMMTLRNMAPATVDFVFDQMPLDNMDDIRRQWHLFKRSPVSKHLPCLSLGHEPVMRDEKEVLPLQAADMLAWLIQNRLDAKFRGAKQWLANRFQTPNVITRSEEWNKTLLQGYLDGLEIMNGGEHPWETKRDRKRRNELFREMNNRDEEA